MSQNLHEPQGQTLGTGTNSRCQKNRLQAPKKRLSQGAGETSRNRPSPNLSGVKESAPVSGFRASDCDANKRVHRSLLPERIENRTERAKRREEQGSATTCRYDRLRRARRQQVSGRQNTSSWLAPPRAQGISWAQKLLTLPCTDFSPTEVFTSQCFSKTYIRIVLVHFWS